MKKITPRGNDLLVVRFFYLPDAKHPIRIRKITLLFLSSLTHDHDEQSTSHLLIPTNERSEKKKKKKILIVVAGRDVDTSSPSNSIVHWNILLRSSLFVRERERNGRNPFFEREMPSIGLRSNEGKRGGDVVSDRTRRLISTFVRGTIGPITIVRRTEEKNLSSRTEDRSRIVFFLLLFLSLSNDLIDRRTDPTRDSPFDVRFDIEERNSP